MQDGDKTLFKTASGQIQSQIFYFYPSDAQLDFSTRMLNFTLKFTLKCSYVFQFNSHHQGAIIRTFLKL